MLLLQKWEHLVKKITDFENHRKFTLGCFSKDITQVSIKLKNTVRTPKNYEIIR